MSFERCLVKVLWYETLQKGVIHSERDFVEFFIAAKNLPCSRCTYCKNRIQFTLEDCIKHEYIEVKNELLKVTAHGKAFLKKIGFLEEVLKRHRRTSIAIGASLAVLISAISLILGSILPYLLHYKT